MILLTDLRKIAQLGNDGKILPTQLPDAPVMSVNGFTGNVLLTVNEIAGAAPVISPVFTGNPTAPTTSLSDNDTSIATTAFVKGQEYAPLASPAFTGNPTAPTPAVADNDTSIATTAFVKAQGYVTNATSWPVTYLAGNGYVKASNGLIIQWGNDAIGGVSNISFPTTFPNACLTVVGGGSANYIQVQTFTSSYFTAAANIYPTTVRWIAIGY
jgi:hypothetical protein